MCIQYIKLKTKNEFGTRYGYVPCGKCVDCRRKLAQAWQFRLNSEFLLLKKKNWNVAFCTLTYSDKKLPKIPKVLFKDETQYSDIPCFSKSDVQDWIKSIRQYCKYHYKFVKGNNIRYFVACEYGTNTHRPHYHALLAWPPTLSYEEMHALCKHFWQDKGIMFPRKPEGDYNPRSGKEIRSFEVVGDCSKVLSYCSKYACKDVDHEELLERYNLKMSHGLMKKCRSFHIQSQSLGFECIKNMTDEQKRDVFINGLAFQGDGEVYQVPMYIKNKIVFDNYYVFDSNGKRLVKRKASEFFEKYRKEMYEEKAKFYEQVFSASTSKDWFVKRGVEESVAERFENSIGDLKDRLNYSAGYDVFGSGMLGKLYLAYFGVKYESCRCYYSEDDLVEQWMCRYRKEDISEHLMRGKERLVWSCWKSLQDYCSLVLGCNTYCNLLNIQQRSDDEKLKKKILDYYNNVVNVRLIK